MWSNTRAPSRTRRSIAGAPLFFALALACAPKSGDVGAEAPTDAGEAAPGRQIPTVAPVHFADAKTPVTSTMENRVNIDRAATLLKNDGDLHLLLIGRTDSVGAPAAKNLERGMTRAREVRDDIIRRVGVDEARIKLGSRGQANPVASNEEAEGRADNRRVEFFFYYPDGEKLRSRFDFNIVIEGEAP